MVHKRCSHNEHFITTADETTEIVKQNYSAYARAEAERCEQWQPR